MNVVYKHRAVVDLQQTQEYIETKLGNPKAARKLISSILHAVSLLRENPAMGIYFISDPDGYWLEVIPGK